MREEERERIGRCKKPGREDVVVVAILT